MGTVKTNNNNYSTLSCKKIQAVCQMSLLEYFRILFLNFSDKFEIIFKKSRKKCNEIAVSASKFMKATGSNVYKVFFSYK